MRSVCIPLLLMVISLPVSADEKPTLETTKQKVSYGIGLNIGRQFKQQSMDVDPKLVAAGIATILAGNEPLISDEDLRAAFDAIRAEAAAAQKKLVATNKAAADKFLKENSAKAGVKQTKSGLQYIVLKEGTGATPTTNDSVAAHYRGKLLDGTTFDESYKGAGPTANEEPITFGVTQVISGWTEALQLMKVGAKYRLFIPPHLAYKAPGRPGIPPNALLTFDIELMAVNPK